MPFLPLQAAIAACHARARTGEETDWARIVALYGASHRGSAVRDFIEQSLAQEESEQRERETGLARTARLQRLTRWAFLAGAVVILIAGGVIALIESYYTQQAFFSRRTGDEVAAARGKDLLHDDDPHLVLLFALEFLKKEVYGSATEALAYKAR